jgi:DNA polymerase-1
VHDELVFESPPDEHQVLEQLVVDHMQNAVPLSVPLPVDIGWGPNWGAAH